MQSTMKRSVLITYVANKEGSKPQWEQIDYGQQAAIIRQGICRWVLHVKEKQEMQTACSTLLECQRCALI